MLLYNNRISSAHIFPKFAQIIPEQTLNETVSIYVDAIPYIECQIQSTIQHEAGHRSDEESRNKDVQLGKNVLPFDQFSQENRVEGIAEQEEENCDGLYPELSGNSEVKNISLQYLFNNAKQKANIDSNYRSDIRAGSLSPDAQGMYLMQDLPFELKATQTDHPNLYRGMDGTLWVDVRKIVEPFMTNEEMKPPTFQSDGMQPDIKNISNQPPTSNAIPAQSSMPVVPDWESK